MASEQSCGAFGCVEFAVRIQRGGGREPARCILGTTSGQKDVCVGVPKPNGARARVLSVEAAARQHGQCGVELTEVATSTGDDDQQFGASLCVEPPDIRLAEHLRGLLRPAERTFTVGDHRQVARVSGYSPGGAKLGERLGPFAGVIRGDSHGFAHRSDPCSTRSRGARELERAAWVGVDGFASGDQILGHRLSVRLAQRAKLSAHAAIKQRWVGVLWDGRVLRVRDALGRTPPSAGWFVSRTATARSVVEAPTTGTRIPPTAAVA